MKTVNYVLLLIVLTFIGILSIESYAIREIKLWYIEWDKESNDYLTYKIVNIADEDYTPQGILDLIYKENKIIEPKVILIKNGVAYINIEGDSSYITDRSGTTGAFHFAAQVVYNLSEFKDIESIYFVDEGDHFSSGRYSRIDYWGLMSTKEKRKYKGLIEGKLNAKHVDVAKYVEMLKDIGDEKTISSLRELKEQLEVVDYGGCLMTRTEFIELIDNTIREVQKRIHRAP